MRNTAIVVVVMACVIGCTNGATEGEGGGGAAEGGAGGEGGGAGGETSCPSGSHRSAGGPCESTLTVTRSQTTLAPARDHHTSLVVMVGSQPFLYVIGGGTDDNTTIYADIQRAPIAVDGALGPFEKVGEMPEPRLGHATVLVDGTLVVVGGLTGGSAERRSLKTTAIATLQQDGSLGPWSTGLPLPTPVMHHTCDANGRWIYCIGGRISGNYTSAQAVRTEVMPDGTLAPFEAVTPLSESIGFHQSFVHGGALYLAGGLHRDAPAESFDMLHTVSRAVIAPDGALGPWLPAGDLPSSIHAGAAQPFLDHVYFVGGMDHHGETLDSILVASIAQDGSLEGFTTSPATLGSPRMHVHQTPLYARWIYSVGGRDAANESSGVIDIGAFE